jgi:hypothetical protein
MINEVDNGRGTSSSWARGPQDYIVMLSLSDL